MNITDTELTGTWSFVSCVAKTSTGEVTYPWGQNSTGLLSYTPDGYVFVSRMSTSDFESYCGKYSIEDNTVTHHIDICSMPVFVGTEQKRFFAINNDQLELKIGPIEQDGISHEALLVWKRAA